MNPTTPTQPIPSAAPKWRSLSALGIFFFVLAGLVFVAPWYLPGKNPVESVSWLYGFNNLVAVLGVGGMLAVMLGWLLFFKPPQGLFADVRRGLLQLLPGEAQRAGDKRLFRVVIAFWAVAMGLMMGWFWFLPYAYFGEAGYFLPRLDWMVMGKVPYRDFVLNYGPLEVYLSYWFYDLGVGTLSTEQAYAMSVALHWLGGLCLIYYVLTRFLGDFSRIPIFCVIAFSTFNFSLGLNYTPLRFIIGFACVLGMHQVVLHVVTQKWAALKVAVAAFIAPLASFAVSPEMGMAAWLGCLAWFAMLWRTPLRRFCWGLIPVALALPGTALLFSPNYFESMLSFGGGGYSFPIYPTLFVLLFLLMVFCVSPALAALGLRLREPNGALAAGLCMVTGVPIMAALGRCDPGHLASNGMGISILFLAALAKVRSRWSMPATILYGLVFVICLNVSGWSDYGASFKKAVRVRAQLESIRKPAKPEPVLFNGLRYSKMLPIPPAYDRLFVYPALGIPLGCEERMERFLKLSGRLVFEYHMSPGGDVLNESQARRKIADMEKMQFILVPELLLQPVSRVDLKVRAQADSESLSKLMLFPIKLKPLNEPFNLTKDIVREIKANYSQVTTVGVFPQSYSVLRRNGPR